MAVPSLRAREDVDPGTGPGAAHVLGQAPPGVLDLPVAGLPAELEDRLPDLRQARGAHGVALGLETAGGVHRNAAAERGRQRGSARAESSSSEDSTAGGG